jgi:hypothetical protein
MAPFAYRMLPHADVVALLCQRRSTLQYLVTVARPESGRQDGRACGCKNLCQAQNRTSGPTSTVCRPKNPPLLLLVVDLPIIGA